MIDSTDTNASAIIAAARLLGMMETTRPEHMRIGNLDVLINREGIVTSLERHQDRPRRKRASATFHEASSFIDYVQRHKLVGRTHLFGVANELGGQFSAILDYHSGGDDTIEAPGWGEHTAIFNLATTPEWQRWIGANGRLLTQEQFAEFIEDNQTDIIEPAAADILDMAQLLQGTKTVTFKSGRNLKNGTVQLQYVEQLEAGRRDDAMTLPDKFKLGIIPFVGAFGVEVEARLRFRIGDGGKVSFSYILNRPYKVIEDAFKHTRRDIEEKTGLSVMLGGAAISKPGSV